MRAACGGLCTGANLPSARTSGRCLRGGCDAAAPRALFRPNPAGSMRIWNAFDAGDCLEELQRSLEALKLALQQQPDLPQDDERRHAVRVAFRELLKAMGELVVLPRSLPPGLQQLPCPGMVLHLSAAAAVLYAPAALSAGKRSGCFGRPITKQALFPRPLAGDVTLGDPNPEATSFMDMGESCMARGGQQPLPIGCGCCWLPVERVCCVAGMSMAVPPIPHLFGDCHADQDTRAAIIAVVKKAVGVGRLLNAHADCRPELQRQVNTCLAGLRCGLCQPHACWLNCAWLLPAASSSGSLCSTHWPPSTPPRSQLCLQDRGYMLWRVLCSIVATSFIDVASALGCPLYQGFRRLALIGLHWQAAIMAVWVAILVSRALALAVYLAAMAAYVLWAICMDIPARAQGLAALQAGRAAAAELWQDFRVAEACPRLSDVLYVNSDLYAAALQHNRQRNERVRASWIRHMLVRRQILSPFD